MVTRYSRLYLYLLNAFIVFILLVFYTRTLWGQEAWRRTKKSYVCPRGVWVTSFSEKKVLYSREAVTQLIEFCKKNNIRDIYLQLFRASQAYYDTHIIDRSKYEEILKTAGIDTVDFLLQEAYKNNLKVFAWVNALSVGLNKKAPIIVQFGETILTRDQYLRPSMRSEGTNESDHYYLRDEQLFLEPGDSRVVDYIFSIVKEIITRYPTLSGIHLDYIRYPNPIPFIPDSRFKDYGLSYGYGKNNIIMFKAATGIDPLTMKDAKDNVFQWDNWKRERVTILVERISGLVKTQAPYMLLSCAVIPAPERAYSIAFQDWPLWLEKNLVDHVVLMNYTRDNRLATETVKSALAHRGHGKVYVGVGVFLIKDEPALFSEQYHAMAALKPDGIVFFSYDDLVDNVDTITHD